MAVKNDTLTAVSTTTEKHVIEISEGCLSIGEKHFPDESVSLSTKETEAVLNLLLVWKYGLEAVCPSDGDPLMDLTETKKPRTA